MKIEFLIGFEKDLTRTRDKKLAQTILDCIHLFDNAKKLEEIPSIKKLKGLTSHLSPLKNSPLKNSPLKNSPLTSQKLTSHYSSLTTHLSPLTTHLSKTLHQKPLPLILHILPNKFL